MSELTVRCNACGYEETIGLPTNLTTAICPKCGKEIVIGSIDWKVRAEKAEAKFDELKTNVLLFLNFIKCGKNEKAHLQMLVIESLVEERDRK